LAVPSLWLSPGTAFAQTTGIAGVVKDTTGAVLPGVTVEASSPALIEKSRIVITDGQGQYKVVDLRPGTYVVTFSLSGFNTVRREGVELNAAFTATVNADLRVGSLSETITVAGQAPTVDIKRAATEGDDSRNHRPVPTGSRSFSNLAVLIPGTSTGSDVGGTLARNNAVTIHDTRATEAVVLFDGMPVNHGGGVGGAQVGLNFNNGAVQEISIQTGGLSAESELGGLVSTHDSARGREQPQRVVFGNYTNGHLQSNNLTDALIASGLTAVDSVDTIWDFNPGMGGPILRDKLWFYLSARAWGTNTLVAGNFFNATPGTDPPTYTPDRSRQATYPLSLGAYSGRLNWQPTPRNKVTAYYSLERAVYEHYISQTLDDPDVTLTSNWRHYVGQLRWNSPVITACCSRQDGSTSTSITRRRCSRGVWAALLLSRGRPGTCGNYQRDPAGNAPGRPVHGPGRQRDPPIQRERFGLVITGSHAAGSVSG
jgi:hypothetical protein